MTHDDIVSALEAHRKAQGMRKGQFAVVVLGIVETRYSELLSGKLKFNVKMLRQLYALGIPADVLLGVKRTGVSSNR